jgi:hypothetical protein
VPRAKHGEIWMADLGLAAKVCPALILSVSFEGHEQAIVSYVIRTTSLRTTQYECLTKLVACRKEHSTRKVWVRCRCHAGRADRLRQGVFARSTSDPYSSRTCQGN